jgi:molybdopterin converting factor small subunit
MTTVRIPTPLRNLTDGAQKVTVEGSTVREVLRNLEAAHPGVGERLLDEHGNVRRFVNVFVDDEDIRFQEGLDTPVPEGATVSVIPAVAGGSEQTVFPFRFDPRFRIPLLAIGVAPSTSMVIVTSQRLLARYGPWKLETPRSNIADAKVTGPYRFYRAVGPRVSGTDRGLTFGTNAEQGVCVLFHEPVPGIDPVGKVRHPGLTLTVVDCDGLVDALFAAETWKMSR